MPPTTNGICFKNHIRLERIRSLDHQGIRTDRITVGGLLCNAFFPCIHLISKHSMLYYQLWCLEDTYIVTNMVGMGVKHAHTFVEPEPSLVYLFTANKKYYHNWNHIILDSMPQALFQTAGGVVSLHGVPVLFQTSYIVQPRQGT